LARACTWGGPYLWVMLRVRKPLMFEGLAHNKSYQEKRMLLLCLAFGFSWVVLCSQTAEHGQHFLILEHAFTMASQPTQALKQPLHSIRAVQPALASFNRIAVGPTLGIAAPETWTSCRRHTAVCAQKLSSPFFSTDGRLLRGAPPPDNENNEVQSRVFVPVYKGLSLVRPSSLEDQRLFEPALLSEDQAAPFLKHPESIETWLGSASEGELPRLVTSACSIQGLSGFWLLELSHLPEQPTASDLGFGPDAQVAWEPLRDRAGMSVCDALAADDYAAVLATARGMALWHRSHQFCSKCGSPTEPCRAGKNRQCTSCKVRVRPRLDPSIIVLVTSGSRCLLARNSRWPEGRFSTLSGFVEFGETLEECIAREVAEETGAVVKRSSIKFVGSQPWLFPQTFLVGFICEAEEKGIILDQEELADARWFDKREVQAMLADSTAEAEGRFHVPSRVSLANTLLRTWAS